MEEFISTWNNTWHYDFWYRQKYGIAFNSPEHQELCQIDIKLNFIEQKMAEREVESHLKRKQDEEEYKKTGSWLKKRIAPVSEELWDALDISKIE
jgi:hypothetical protein